MAQVNVLLQPIPYPALTRANAEEPFKGTLVVSVFHHHDPCLVTVPSQSCKHTRELRFQTAHVRMMPLQTDGMIHQHKV